VNGNVPPKQWEAVVGLGERNAFQGGQEEGHYFAEQTSAIERALVLCIGKGRGSTKGKAPRWIFLDSPFLAR